MTVRLPARLLLPSSAASLLSFFVPAKRPSFTKDIRRLGNCLHVATIILNLFYVSVALYEVVTAHRERGNKDLKVFQLKGSGGARRIMDPVWLDNGGYCIAKPHDPEWNSHMMSCWIDLFFTAVCTCLYLALRKQQGMEAVNKIFSLNIPGIFFHGLGHASFAAMFREHYINNGTTNDLGAYVTGLEDYRDDTWMPTVHRDSLLVVVFWTSLLKAALNNLPWILVFPLGMLASLGQVYVPIEFSFAYIWITSTLCFSINQLARPAKEKDWSYASHPVIVGIPLNMMTWVEATCCDAFVRDYLYGHAMFDSMLPLSLIAYYVINYLHANHGLFESKVKSE
jgi:hypothetical protein